MNQSRPLYDMVSALETLEPWLEQHLPDLESVARRHFVHLVTGIIEQQSLLIHAIAAASPFGSSILNGGWHTIGQSGVEARATGAPGAAVAATAVVARDNATVRPHSKRDP